MSEYDSTDREDNSDEFELEEANRLLDIALESAEQYKLLAETMMERIRELEALLGAPHHVNEYGEIIPERITI